MLEYIFMIMNRSDDRKCLLFLCHFGVVWLQITSRLAGMQQSLVSVCFSFPWLFSFEISDRKRFYLHSLMLKMCLSVLFVCILLQVSEISVKFVLEIMGNCWLQKFILNLFFISLINITLIQQFGFYTSSRCTRKVKRSLFQCIFDVIKKRSLFLVSLIMLF